MYEENFVVISTTILFPYGYKLFTSWLEDRSPINYKLVFMSRLLRSDRYFVYEAQIDKRSEIHEAMIIYDIMTAHKYRPSSPCKWSPGSSKTSRVSTKIRRGNVPATTRHRKRTASRYFPCVCDCLPLCSPFSFPSVCRRPCACKLLFSVLTQIDRCRRVLNFNVVRGLRITCPAAMIKRSIRTIRSPWLR